MFLFDHLKTENNIRQGRRIDAEGWTRSPRTDGLCLPEKHVFIACSDGLQYDYACLNGAGRHAEIKICEEGIMIFNLGSRVVNSYLLSSPAGYILVDIGYDGGFPHFLKMLEKIRVRPEDIRYVFLTHAHDDHAGFLNEVLAATDAAVILHPGAVEGLKRGQNSFKGGCSSLGAFLFCGLLALFGRGDHRYPPIRAEYLDRLIPIDSARFRALGFPFEIMETPGHTADHISLRAGDVLFCGDAAMNGFPSVRRTIIWIEDPEQYRRSWEVILEKAPAATLYPGHGRPFRASDLRKYLDSLDRIKLYPLKEKGSGRHQKERK